MVRFALERGRKGDNDTIVLVYAYGEVLSFSELLFLLSKYFESEDGYYPKPRFEGACMLLKAIVEVYSGIPFDVVLRKYGLARKKKLNIIDLRKNMREAVFKVERVISPKSGLDEMI